MKKINYIFLAVILSCAFIFVGCKTEKLVLKQFEPIQDSEEVAVVTTNHGVFKLRFFPEETAKTVENFKGLAKSGYYDGVTFHRTIPGFMIQGGDPTATGMGGESFFGEPFEDEFSLNLYNFYGALSMANSGPATNGSQFFIVTSGPENESLSESIKNYDAVREKALEKDVKIDNILTADPDDKIMLSKLFQKEAFDKYLEVGGVPHLDFFNTQLSNPFAPTERLGAHSVFGHTYEGMDVVLKINNVETDGGDKPLEDVVIEKIEFMTYKEAQGK